MNKKVVLGARLILGLIFVIFGFNGLIMLLTGNGFIPMPPPSPAMGQVMGGFFATKYLIPLVKIIEISAGILLLKGDYITLAITLLAPVVINILGVHLFVDLSGLPLALIIVIALSILSIDQKENFRTLLKK